MKKLLLILIAVLPTIYAFAHKTAYGKNVVITQPVLENLYVAGGSVTINAPIHGDLAIAGGTVIINDTVTGDILAGGGRIAFNGFTAGDLRCAGADVQITKNVLGDVVFAAGTLNINKGVSIGNLLMSSGDAEINGDVTGEIQAIAGQFILNGNAGKGIDCRGETIAINSTINGPSILAATTITTGTNASFNGGIRYWSGTGTVKFPNNKNSQAVYDPSLRINNSQWYFLGSATALGLLWYVGMAFVLILIMQYLFSAAFKKAADSVFNKTGRSLLYGMLFIVAMPVAAVIAFVTIIGVPVGLLLVFIYIASLLLASIITSVMAANWINNRYNYNWKYWHLVFISLLSFIVLKMVSALPLAGWLFMAFAVCLSLGGILISVRWKNKSLEA